MLKYRHSIFYSHKIYSTSNTVDSESIKDPNQFLAVVTVIAAVFQAGGHRLFLLSPDTGSIIQKLKDAISARSRILVQ